MAIKENIMFSTVDSVTYWLTSQEFYKFSVKGYSELRPFLYPLIIVIIHKLFGIIGIWLMQLFFWIISINLLFLSIKKITNNRLLSFAGSLIIALNVSFIVLTIHALTEATTIALLSLLIYYVACNVTKVKTLKFFHISLFILVLLAVIKPIFFTPILILLFIILPVYHLKKYIQNPKNFIKLILIITPLLFQLTIMKVKYNTFSFSNIGSESFRLYYFTQGIQQNNTISLAEARAIAKNLTPEEVYSYLFNNKMVYTKIYLQNLHNAVKSVPCFILYPYSFYQEDVVNYMIIVNTFYYYFHFIFLIPVLVFIYFAYRRRELNYYLVPLIFSSFLAYYFLLASAISFGEGDRHVLISLPLWVFLYTMILDFIFKKNGLFKIIRQKDLS